MKRSSPATIASVLLLVAAVAGCDAGEVDEYWLGDGEPVALEDDAYAAGTDTLRSGESLAPGEYLVTSTGYLYYQHDGNLVLYRWGGQAVWSSRTWGKSPNVTVMQHDGNLVVYDASWRPVWYSGTHNSPGAFAQIGGSDLRLFVIPVLPYCPLLGQRQICFAIRQYP